MALRGAVLLDLYRFDSPGYRRLFPSGQSVTEASTASVLTDMLDRDRLELDGDDILASEMQEREESPGLCAARAVILRLTRPYPQRFDSVLSRLIPPRLNAQDANAVFRKKFDELHCVGQVQTALRNSHGPEVDAAVVEVCLQLRVQG